MNFQIRKIILWPKNTKFSYNDDIVFEYNKVNIITGASRTGKSAIVPIIDYCLGSGECRIPVDIIRKACSWFGIVIKTNNGEILLARREPESSKETGDMYIQEAENIVIPTIPEKNTNVEFVKAHLNEISSISFLGVEADTVNNYLGRPSFRDLAAFNFQPQNIVTNPNTLFYKADTSEHRTKLINIFPYILGAVTPELLEKKQEISRLEKELYRKERDLSRIKDVADKWNEELNSWLSTAVELGLVDTNEVSSDCTFEKKVELLEQVSNKKAADSTILQKNIEDSANEIIGLRKEESDISLNLSMCKSRFTEMTHLMESVQDYRQSLTIQMERLHISGWLKSLSKEESICPFCKNVNEHPINQVEKFYNALQGLERDAGESNRIPASFEREYEMVKTEMTILTEKLEAVQKRIKIQSGILNSSKSEKYTLENISRFIGQVQYAVETFESIGSDSQLISEIEVLRAKLKKLKALVDEKAIYVKITNSLRTIEKYTMKLIEYLDSEWPDAPIEIDYKNLTISILRSNGRKDYLWEIGSGSNWLCYHISVILAFQLFFINDLIHSPVPNFTVFDQPSQVYFPRKLSSKESEAEIDPHLDDEDKIAVTKIFNTMSKAIKLAKKPLQVIVLEHADENIWGEVENVYKVAEWRGEGKKLIPSSWYSEQ